MGTVFNLKSWQKEFIASTEPKIIMLVGRKGGKTEALAEKIVEDATSGKCPEESDGILILSRGQRQARELFTKVKAYLQLLGHEFYPHRETARKNNAVYASMTELEMPDGTKVYALPCGFDGVTIRTYSFWKIYRDEDAYIPEAVDAAVSACLGVYGVQEIRASSAGLAEGSFFKIYKRAKAYGFHVIERTTKQCGLVTDAFLVSERRRLGKLDFQREYENIFADILEGIYPRELYGPALKWDVPWAELAKRCMIFYGHDYARFGDDENCIATCFYDAETDHCYVRIEIITSKVRTTHMVGRQKNLCEDNGNWRYIVTDSNGVGTGATDMLLDLYGSKRVIGISNQEKREDPILKKKNYVGSDLHMHLRRRLENGTITLDDDPAIIHSLRSMQPKYTQDGNMTVHGNDNHAAEAIVRALFPVIAQRARYTGPISVVQNSLSPVDDGMS